MSQLPVPEGIYLHEAIVEGAVPVVVDGSGIEIAFCFCDGPEKLWRYSVRFASLFKAKGPNMTCCQNDKDSDYHARFQENIRERSKPVSEKEKKYSFGDPTVKNRTPILVQGLSEGT